MLLNLGPLYLFSPQYSSGYGSDVSCGRIWYCINNMSEIQTHHTESSEKPLDESYYNEIYEWQAIDAAAKRMVEEEKALNTEPATPDHSLRNKLIVTGAAAAASVAAFAGINAVDSESVSIPTFSEQTTTYTVQDGEGLYDAAESIPGINSIDVRDAVEHISVDPANIDILKDGLQVGEQISVPISINGVDTSKE